MFRLPRLGKSAAHIRRAIGSLAATSGLHLILLATLAVVVAEAHPGSAVRPLCASLALPADVGTLDGSGLERWPSESLAPQHPLGGVSAGPSAAVAEATGQILLPSPLEIDRSKFLPAHGSWLESIELVSTDRDAKAVDESAGEESTGDGAAGSEKAGAGLGGAAHSFFGLEAGGEKVVFVVDISGSMKGRRFFRARSELERSIESLQKHQQFFVIFFNGDALPMPGDRLLPATESNVSQAVEWIKYVECGGGTNPLPGLMMAISLRPDAIYLLTDGRFDPQTVWEVARAEPEKPIPIYTISFASRSAERLLKAIARQTGGVYRFAR